jgi:hypothetical protein
MSVGLQPTLTGTHALKRLSSWDAF